MKLFGYVFSGTLVIFISASIIIQSCQKDGNKSVECLNGGSLNNGNCVCPTGWIGTRCESLAFDGTWSGTDSCTSPLNTYNVTIKLDTSTNSSNITISNPGGMGTNNTIIGTLNNDGTVITYTNQYTISTVATITYHDTLTGTITLTDNSHFIHSYSDQSGVVYTCHGYYIKQ